MVMDMVHPSMDTLLKMVDSKYTLSVLAAKRARDILEGAAVKIEDKSTKDVTNALGEIAEGKISYERTKVGIK